MPHQCTNCGRTFADGSKEMLSGCPDCGGNKFQFAPATAPAADSSDGAADSGMTEAPADPDGDAPAGDTASTDPSDGRDSVTTRATATVREWITGDDSDERDRAAAESTTQSSPDDVAATTGSDRSWPSSDAAAAVETDDGGGSFAEWPETARRPEDRTADSTGTGDEADTLERSSRESNGATTTLADDENSAQADARSEVVPADDLPTHDGPAVSDLDDSVDAAETTQGPPADTDRPPEHGRVVSEPSGDKPSIEDLRKELNEQFESIKIVRPGQYELNLMELYDRDEYIISLQEDGRYVIDVPDSWRDGDDSDE